jgi:hypothetical protein
MNRIENRLLFLERAWGGAATREAHGSSCPVFSLKPALGAVFARTRTELCPSRKELP